jgi:hypothetical protein
VSADIVYLDTLRQCRHLPPARPEALLPPIGKRPGDRVQDARGRRGTVISYATRAVAVIPADDAEPVSGPVVDEAALGRAPAPSGHEA